MCLGGGASTPSVKPVPAPPPVQPAPPPRQAAEPRKPVEQPGVTPDVQLGGQKKSSQRNSLRPQTNAGSQGPNTGTTPGALNI